MKWGGRNDFLLMTGLRVRGLGVDVLISSRRRRDYLFIVGLRLNLNLLLAIFVPRRVLSLVNGHSGVSVALRRAVLPFAAALTAGVSLRKLSNSSLL